MLKKERFSVIVDVHLFLVRGGKILLLKRAKTGYMDGYYHLPAGHMDGNERLVDALIRESKEEVGIKINPKDAKLVHTIHNKSDTERLAFFFEVKKWTGRIKNIETDKHSELEWFELKKLPRKTVPYAKAAINNYINKDFFSHFGWSK